MKNQRNIFIVFVFLLLTSLACSVSLPNSVPDEDVIEQTAQAAVAETLAARVNEPVLVTTNIEFPEPTPESSEPTPEIPEPTPTALPEKTSTPLPFPTPTPIIKTRPDQLRIVMVDTNNNLLTWEDGGALNTIVNTGDVSNAIISEDGEWIVFTRTSADWVDISLWAVRFDGSEQHVLINHSQFMAMPVHPSITNTDEIVTIAPYMIKFIPGTHTAAFNTSPQFMGPGFMDNKDFYFINVETADRQMILEAGKAGQYYFSPDGLKIALVYPTKIDLINTDGSKYLPAVLTYPSILTYSEYEYHPEPVWSADGTYLRVSIPPQDPLGTPDSPTAIYSIPADGSPAALIHSVVVSPLSYVHIAPDLNHIAYKINIGDPANNQYSLQLADLTGTPPWQVDSGTIHFLNWGPDSSCFSYIDWNLDGIYIYDLNANIITFVEKSPAYNLSWVTSEIFLYIHTDGTSQILCTGSLTAPGEMIANLGSSAGPASYDFAAP